MIKMNYSLPPISSVIFEKTKDGDQYIDVFARLTRDRVIWINSEITTEVASTISSILFMLNEEDPNEKISMWINSPGGDVYGFYTIYDMMQLIEAPVETICLGKAFSAGALLLAAGSKGKRFATPNARIMIHQVQIDGVGGTGTELEIEAKEVKILKDSLVDILAAHTGQKKRTISKDMEHDKFFSAKDAVKYGLIDNILPFKKQIIGASIGLNEKDQNAPIK